MTKKITLFFNYYNQETNLINQIKLWKTYSNKILNKINILIIDNGSYKRAKNILEKNDISSLPISLYEIFEDKYDNTSGGINLACKVCKTEYILINDIKNYITFEGISKILTIPLDKNNIYNFNLLKSDKLVYTCFNIFLISINFFWHIGGCDEDFVNHMNLTDIIFNYRAKLKNAKFFVIENVFLIEDNLKKNEKNTNNINNDLFNNKKLNNNWSYNFLRFTWQEVLLKN